MVLTSCSREPSRAELTDLERDLQAIDARLAELPSLPNLKHEYAIDDVNLSEVALLWYRRASLTDSFEDLQATATAIDLASRSSQSDDLLLLQAQLDFKLHRVDDAQRALDCLDNKIAGSAVVQAMQADVGLHQGRLKDARRKYESALEMERSWHTLARLAHLESLMGDFASAERLYLAAHDQIAVKEMRAYAWVEVQRGLLDFRRGRYDEALSHCHRADKAYSGDWYVKSNIAKVQGAMGNFELAAKIYGDVLARHARPEFYQAIGDLHALAGDPGQAREWHEKAVAAYSESVKGGDGRYFHHLAEFYSDVKPNGREAVKWARMDLDQRDGTATRQALAWALHTDGQHALAEQELRQAISAGTQDPQLFVRAARIFLAAGHGEEGIAWQRRADEMFTHDHRFHVHH